jgi:hypothetical protein
MNVEEYSTLLSMFSYLILAESAEDDDDIVVFVDVDDDDVVSF